MREQSVQSQLPAGEDRTNRGFSRARSCFHLAHRYGLGGVGAGVTVYGLAAALLVLRAPAIVGERWSWLVVLLIPVLTILMAWLQTGTALALVLIYAFGSATTMAVQGYRLGWNEVAQLDYVYSHFATMVFMASTVALTALLRSRQEQLEQAQQLVERYVSKDATTGLLTRSAFVAAAERELSRSVRTARPFLLLSMDLTAYFAAATGSAAVSSAQRMLAEILSTQTRENQDLWTMWKDNVYLGLLTETDEQAVEPALGRVTKKIQVAPEFAGQALVESARFGVASYPADGATVESLIDQALLDPVPLSTLLERLGEPTWKTPRVIERGTQEMAER